MNETHDLQDLNIKGVIRFDSDVHTDADIALMTPFLRSKIRVAQMRINGIEGRIIINQTTDRPGDTVADRRALIAAMHGLRLVKG